MVQRALGRSPEEKVKGHSGAIYRGPLMLYTKYQGSSRFLQEDFPILLHINQISPPPRQGPILYLGLNLNILSSNQSEPFQQFW